MKTLSRILAALIAFFVLDNVPAQERRPDVRDMTFEEFRQYREQDFQNFVEARERELRAMQQAYQDYYNELHGLRNHYIERNDTERATIVEEIIEFEDQIAKVTGKQVEVTEAVVIEEVPDEKPIAPDLVDPYRPEPLEKEVEKPATTREPDKTREPVKTNNKLFISNK